jgi:uncharacterized protein (TIGR02271 family)
MQIERAARVMVADGTLGAVQEVITDPETGEVISFIAMDDAGHERVIPITAVTHASASRIRLRGNQADYLTADQPGMAEQTLELREERLVPRTELRELGEIRVRTEVETVPGRLEVEGYREEVEVAHVPVGRPVTERTEPRQEGDVLIVPVYEEHLVVVKQLLLREELHIRRVGSRTRHLFEEELQRERLRIEDPAETGLVREVHPSTAPEPEAMEEQEAPPEGLIDKLTRRALG